MNINHLKCFSFPLLVALGMILLVSCTPDSTKTDRIASEEEGFAIYLIKDDTPLYLMKTINNPQLEKDPLITISDVISYDWITHEISLSETGKQKLAKFDLPVGGRVFVICVDSIPAYQGVLYHPASSYYPFEKPVITILPGAKDSSFPFQIKWEPASDNASVSLDDPRDDSRIYESLKKWGKLKEP